MLPWIPNYLSFMPIHRQLVQYIQLKMGSKGFCKGDYLPPVKTMSLYYNISEDSIRKAYSTLLNEGVICLQKNNRRYVFNDLN